MNREELKQYLNTQFPEAAIEDSSEFIHVTVTNENFVAFMQSMRDNPETAFNFLTFMTCIDWKDHFLMVYHLFSRTHKHDLVVNVKIEDREKPEIATVSDLWRTSEFHEREVFDLFGIHFTNHPDLRRLFLTDDWEGHPLRKDYTDENMIEL